MDKEFKLSSFVISFGLVGSLFVYAGLMEIIGDLFGLLVYNNHLTLWEKYLILIVSWVMTLILLLLGLRRQFKKEDFRTSITIGLITSFILVPLLTIGISPVILFGSMDFDITLDYINIIRNLTIGTLSIFTMVKWG